MPLQNTTLFADMSQFEEKIFPQGKEKRQLNKERKEEQVNNHATGNVLQFVNNKSDH